MITSQIVPQWSFGIWLLLMLYTFLPNISLLDDADQYPSCNNEVFGMLY